MQFFHHTHNYCWRIIEEAMLSFTFYSLCIELEELLYYQYYVQPTVIS